MTALHDCAGLSLTFALEPVRNGHIQHICQTNKAKAIPDKAKPRPNFKHKANYLAQFSLHSIILMFSLSFQ